MLIDKKFTKNIWIVILAFGFVSFIIATSDLWTSSLWFQGIYGNSVLVEKVSFPLPHRLVGSAPQVTFEGLLSGLMLMLGQILFAAQAKIKKGNESKMYWAAYAFLAIADTATDVAYRAAGGKITWQLVVTSVVLFNIMSEFGVTLSAVYLWEKVKDIGSWTDNAKENVKNLRGGGGNGGDGNGPRPPKAPTENRHNQRQQRPSFAAQNDVVPTLVQRQPRTMQVNGQTIDRP